MYFTDTSPVPLYTVAIILAVQKSLSFRECLPVFVLDLLGPTCPFLLPSLQQTYVTVRAGASVGNYSH